MSLKHFFRQLQHSRQESFEYQREIALREEIAVVTRKELVPEVYRTFKDASVRFPAEQILHAQGNYSFELSKPGLFENVNIGDKVKVIYHEIRRTTRDYVPPDFEEKKTICSFNDYIVLRVDKL
jgi:hypothetical protein